MLLWGWRDGWGLIDIFLGLKFGIFQDIMRFDEFAIHRRPDGRLPQAWRLRDNAKYRLQRWGRHGCHPTGSRWLRLNAAFRLDRLAYELLVMKCKLLYAFPKARVLKLGQRKAKLKSVPNNSC